MRIRPDLRSAEVISPSDRQSWKLFGTSGPGREFVYRLFADDHTLLYVGITWNPFIRWTAHARSKHWWPQVAYAQLWVCPDADARFWESRCIKEQYPRFNIHQSGVQR